MIPALPFAGHKAPPTEALTVKDDKLRQRSIPPCAAIAKSSNSLMFCRELISVRPVPKSPSQCIVPVSLDVLRRIARERVPRAYGTQLGTFKTDLLRARGGMIFCKWLRLKKDTI